jgi:protein CWC15
VDIALGNPLLNAQDFNMKRRWDDDVVFKNQARGTEKKEGKEFVNVSLYECLWKAGILIHFRQDLLRSDFHKRFMVCFLSLLSFEPKKPKD